MSVLIGHVATYLLLTLGIVAMKIMRENRVVLNVAFNSHVQSLVRENCTLLCQLSDSTVKVKSYSSSDVSRKERVALAKNEIPPESIAGFVTCLHEENWWLACVLEVCSDTKEVKLTFLHPHGPSNSFKYPEPQNIHTIPLDDILTLIDPRTRSGRVYSLTKKYVMTFATKQLHTVSPQ